MDNINNTSHPRRAQEGQNVYTAAGRGGDEVAGCEGPLPDDLAGIDTEWELLPPPLFPAFSLAAVSTFCRDTNSARHRRLEQAGF